MLLISLAHFSSVNKISAYVILYDQSINQAIASLAPQYTTFPITPDEEEKVMVSFYKIATFPRAVGAVDCIHIKI